MLTTVVAAEGNAIRYRGAAHAIVWPIVFNRITAPMERRRGHWSCARSVHGLAAECLDRFHDDVDAAVDDLLRNARTPIEDLDGWVGARLRRSTVDAHRRRRGAGGAQQRVRVPGWLAAEVDNDPWLVALAHEMLVWVGIAAVAGTDIWPIDAWTSWRAQAHDGDDGGAAALRRDIARVLRAMQTRQWWFDRYVATGLARKQATLSLDELIDRHGADPTGIDTDSWLAHRAAVALSCAASRLATGQPGELDEVVVDSLRHAFGGGAGSAMQLPPGADDALDEHLEQALADPRRRAAIVRAVKAALALSQPARIVIPGPRRPQGALEPSRHRGDECLSTEPRLVG